MEPSGGCASGQQNALGRGRDSFAIRKHSSPTRQRQTASPPTINSLETRGWTDRLGLVYGCCNLFQSVLWQNQTAIGAHHRLWLRQLTRSILQLCHPPERAFIQWYSQPSQNGGDPPHMPVPSWPIALVTQRSKSNEPVLSLHTYICTPFLLPAGTAVDSTPLH